MSEHEVIKALRIAEHLLRGNRYLAEADLCKSAIAKQEALLRDVEHIRQLAVAGGHELIIKIAEKLVP
jgi:hypothetical protein